jgi:hypothetical protein
LTNLLKLLLVVHYFLKAITQFVFVEIKFVFQLLQDSSVFVSDATTKLLPKLCLLFFTEFEFRPIFDHEAISICLNYISTINDLVVMFTTEEMPLLKYHIVKLVL